jgi:hypothetical protein
MKLHLEPKEVLELHEILCEVMPRLKDPRDMMHVNGQLRQYILACMTRGDREEKDDNMQKWLDRQQELLRTKVAIDQVPPGITPADLTSKSHADILSPPATPVSVSVALAPLTSEQEQIIRNSSNATHEKQILHVDPCELDGDTYGQYPSTKNKGGHRKYNHHKKK